MLSTNLPLFSKPSSYSFVAIVSEIRAEIKPTIKVGIEAAVEAAIEAAIEAMIEAEIRAEIKAAIKAAIKAEIEVAIKAVIEVNQCVNCMELKQLELIKYINKISEIFLQLIDHLESSSNMC